MTPADYPEFVKIISALSEMYGKAKPSDVVIALWWQALKDFELPAIRKGLSMHVMNPDSGQFMPRPADVVKMLGGSTADNALLAWSKVSEAVRRIGSYDSVVFDDPIIHAVIYDMGGWVVVSMKGDDEWDFVRNEFVNRYRGYAIRGETPSYPPVLIGIFETHNSKEGYKSQPPRLVGDPEKAKAVMSGGTKSRLEISPSHAQSTFMRLVA